ncbi:MAG TPA: alkaline phosphatase family protein [Gemmatimonadales bacterium]|nr:alkaline phosphatase family protein [Gemmatimonadales bacterium]
MTPTTRCLLLLVDGLRPDVAEARLEAGDLPHLEAMLRTGGRTRAITVFPSTTSVAYLPFLTGCTPGTCNVPSIRWLDRRAYGGRWWRERGTVRSYCGYQAPLLDDDIAPHVRTIFELVPDSLGLFTPIARGLGDGRDPSRRERQIWGAVAHFAQWHQPSDDAVARHLLRAVDGPARFVFAQFPAVDGYTHQTDPDAEPVRRALRKVDAVVGEVRRRLTARGELASTLMLLVSDHGASPVHTHLDLADWCRSQGVPTLSHPVVWERSPRAAVMVAGNGSAMIYARPGEPRAERWPLARLRRPEAFGVADDLIDALLREPAVGLVAAETGDGGVWVGDADGAAIVNRRAGHVAYEPLAGDPLGCGGPRSGSPRDWLEATWDAAYPDAAYHLLDQFRSERAGDLLVIAREGYDFRRRFEVPEHRAGHGSLTRSHMQTPLWSSEPLPAEPLRTVDVFPSMLDWLEVPIPETLDGEAVWRPGERLRRPTDARTFDRLTIRIDQGAGAATLDGLSGGGRRGELTATD